MKPMPLTIHTSSSSLFWIWWTAVKLLSCMNPWAYTVLNADKQVLWRVYMLPFVPIWIQLPAFQQIETRLGTHWVEQGQLSDSRFTILMAEAKAFPVLEISPLSAQSHEFPVLILWHPLDQINHVAGNVIRLTGTVCGKALLITLASC